MSDSKLEPTESGFPESPSARFLNSAFSGVGNNNKNYQDNWYMFFVWK